MNINDFFNLLGGFSFFMKQLFVKRFELTYFFFYKNTIFFRNEKEKIKIFNSYFSFITNTNSNINDLLRYNLIRLYLTRTFRGRAQALGKPCRGQRTWSNAWTAYKVNTVIRSFITQVNKTKKKPKIRKIYQKIVKRKLFKSTVTLKPRKQKKKINTWH